MENIKRYYDLRKEIEKYDDLYYNKNKSVISDYEYDMLRKELESIENQYPHLGKYARNNVGAKLSLNRFPKVEHKYRMTSLKNTYTIEELFNWMRDIWHLCEEHNTLCVEKPNITELFHAEWKFDGLSISLKYNKDGILIQALTRGDGEYGEDITENAYEIESIPKQIKISDKSQLYPALMDALEHDGWIEVRGEILMSYQEFERINALRKIQGEELYANPRNLASGTLRNLDKSIFKDRELLFAPYHLENVWFNMNYLPFLKEFKNMGFCPFDNLKAVFQFPHHELDMEPFKSFIYFLQTSSTDRMQYNDLTIPIDGLVIKTQKYYFDQLKFMKTNASTRYPIGAIAYKFQPETYNTKLIDITYQVGRSGKITPVAELIPVKIDGSTISRCTLHNFDEINRLSLRKNCYVDIIKSAAVIPKIIGRQSQIGIDETIIDIPTKCPVCGSDLVKYKGVSGADSVDVYCSNSQCPAVVKQQNLYHFNTLNVKGFGPALYDAFNEAFIAHFNVGIKSFVEIYSICFSKDKVWSDILLTVRNIAGSKNVQNFIDSLTMELSKNIFYRQLASLGIDGIGLQTAKDIETKCQDFNDFIMHYNEYNLAENIIKYLNENKDKAFSIIEYGLKLKAYLNSLNIPFLQNSHQKEIKDYAANVVLTGTFDFGSRNQISKFLDDNYIKVQPSVSKATDVLIAGANAGSKLDKAKELGIITIYPRSYDDLINQIQAAQK